PHVLLSGNGQMLPEQAQDLIAQVKQFPQVASATAYVADNVMVDCPVDQRAVDFRAVDTSDPAQVQGLKNLLDTKAYPGSSADLGIDDRVIISSQVAVPLDIKVGDKIRLISTRNVREVIKIFKTTERPPVREAFSESWAKISDTLQNGWKSEGEAHSLPLDPWRETYTLLMAIFEEDIRQPERDRVEAILRVMDESEKNEDTGAFIFTTDMKSRLEEPFTELNTADAARMDSEVLPNLKGLVLPKEVEVIGIYPASMMAVTPALFVPLPLAQDLAGLGDTVQGIRITLHDPYLAESFKEEAAPRLGPEWNLFTWGDAYVTFFRLIAQQRVMMYFVLIFIMLVSAFSIKAVMFTITIQKRREIGVMKSLGASSGQIIRVFLYQGMILGTLGALLGV
ncbi:MAG: ABC transporter permease, partial [Verrucomicrobiaceae bacterium]